MKKLYLLIVLLLLVGCSTKEEDNKYAYLEYKNNLEERKDFYVKEELDFKFLFNIEKKGDITIYSLIIDNPRINMYNIKALLIHDGIAEDAYPSVGIFDKPMSLLTGIDNEIRLEGSTTNDVENMNFKLYIEYTDENNKEYKVYYKL